MEHLKEKIRLVTYDPKTDDLEKWAKNLVIDLENAYSDIAKRVNWLLDRIKVGEIRIIPSGNIVGDDGNWKITIVGTNLEAKKKLSGTFGKKGAFTSAT